MCREDPSGAIERAQAPTATVTHRVVALASRSAGKRERAPKSCARQYLETALDRATMPARRHVQPSFVSIWGTAPTAACRGLGNLTIAKIVLHSYILPVGGRRVGSGQEYFVFVRVFAISSASECPPRGRHRGWGKLFNRNAGFAVDSPYFAQIENHASIQDCVDGRE